MANTNDLRFLRTEAAIRAAFMELVGEQPVASVTASGICRRAGISRNAFYLHHASVTELYTALVRELVDDVRNESVASANRCVAIGSDDALSAAVMRALARHEDLLRALLPPDDGSLAKCLAEGIEGAYVEAALLFGDHGASLEHRLTCAFAAWAIVGFASRWIAETNRPLTEAIGHFEALQSDIAKLSARYLIGGGDIAPR